METINAYRPVKYQRPSVVGKWVGEVLYIGATMLFTLTIVAVVMGFAVASMA